MTDLTPSAKGRVSFPKTLTGEQKLRRNTLVLTRLRKEARRGALFSYEEKPPATLVLPHCFPHT